MTKKNVSLVTIVIFLLIAVFCGGVGGYYAGISASEKNYKAEKEQTLLINRSELSLFDDVQGPIYVSGHKSPDSDTVAASIGYANLLQKLGYDAHAVVLGKVNLETKFIFDAAQLEIPQILEDVSGLNMVLVDHSEYMQSAQGLKDAKIVAIIDHHGVGSISTGNQLIYDARPLGSTNTIVWLHYRNYGVEIDKKTATVMLGAILSDTCNLVVNTTTADRAAVNALSKTAGISDINAFYDKMYSAAVSYKDMTAEEIFFNDYKEYEAGGKKYAIAIIQVYDESAAENLTSRVKAIIPETMTSRNLDMLFVQLKISLDADCYIASDEAAEEVLRLAFGEKLIRKENFYVLKPGISRKAVLVPALTDVLEAYPKE